MLTSLPWHCWCTAGNGSMGRYLTDTWHAAEALGSEEGRMCSVAAAHISAPHVGADRWQRPPLVCTVVAHFSGCAAWGITPQMDQTIRLWGINQSSPEAHIWNLTSPPFRQQGSISFEVLNCGSWCTEGMMSTLWSSRFYHVFLVWSLLRLWFRHNN